MPRWASRLTLIVTAVKVERLQQMTEWDAACEGIVDIPRSLHKHGRMDGYGIFGTAPEDASKTRVHAFEKLWRSLHGPDSWKANPEVVCLTFTVHKKNIDAMKAAA